MDVLPQNNSANALVNHLWQILCEVGTLM